MRKNQRWGEGEEFLPQRTHRKTEKDKRASGGGFGCPPLLVCGRLACARDGGGDGAGEAFFEVENRDFFGGDGYACHLGEETFNLIDPAFGGFSTIVAFGGEFVFTGDAIHDADGGGATYG